MTSGQRRRLDPSDLANAHFLTMDFRPISEKALELQANLQKIIIAESDKPKRRGRPSNDTAVANAALLIVAEIIDESKGNLERSVCHGLSPNLFTGKDVSYRHFEAAISGLE